MYVKIIDDTFIAGEHVTTDQILEVDDVTAQQLVRCDKAEIIKAPDEAVLEPVKPKVRKVTPTEK